MPRTLTTPTPSSALARLFDPRAAASATSPVPEVTVDAPAIESSPPRSQRGEPARDDRPYLDRQFVLTRTADETFARLVELYRRSTGTRLTASHVLRVILKGVADRLDTLELEARRLGPLRLPSNARGRDHQRELFEARIADAFVRGMDYRGGHDTSRDADR